LLQISLGDRVVQNELEQRFDAEMLQAYESWKRECSYNATRFLQMLRNRGGAESARRLLHKKGTSFGLERLTACRALPLTVEYHVLKPEFAALFTRAELSIARNRLLAKGLASDKLP
jgi:hypothetical protein